MSHGCAERITAQPGWGKVPTQTDNPARIGLVVALQQAGGGVVAEPWKAVPAHGEPWDSALVQRFLQGEPLAVRRVATLARQVAATHAYAMPAADREDVAQEVVLQVYRALTARGFALRSGLEPLVRAVAHRRCVDWMRRGRRMRPLGVDPPSRATAPDDAAARHEEALAGAEVIRRLSEPCREVLRLRIAHGLSHSAVAERLGRSEGGVRNLLSKCLHEARRLLHELDAHRGPGGDRGPIR